MNRKSSILTTIKSLGILMVLFLHFSCGNQQKVEKEAPSTALKTIITPKDILGNPKYLAISYGGYRQNSRTVQPSVAELKEDMKILAAMGIGILRTYNVQLPHAENVLEAIQQLKKEDPSFEMYVMLGAWINCDNAWTESPNHEKEDVAGNIEEIEKTVALANKYPEIVKVIAVGNEAMVHWAATYFVRPQYYLKMGQSFTRFEANQ